MELKRYFFIILRYWILVAILTGIGVVAAFQYYTSNRPTYQAVVKVNLTQLPSQNDIYSGLYAVQAAEYATDEFTGIVNGSFFLTQISNRLGEGGLNLSADELKGMLEIEKKHRVLDVSVRSTNPDNALKVAQLIGNTLEANASDYVKPRQVIAKIVDISSQASKNGGRNVLLAIVRVLVGFLAGVFLAFMINYLDTSIKNKEDSEEATGLPVLASVPAYKASTTQAGGIRTGRTNDPIGARLASLQEKGDAEQVGTRK